MLFGEGKFTGCALTGPGIIGRSIADPLRNAKKSLRGATLARRFAFGEISGIMEAEGLIARDVHALTGVAWLDSAISRSPRVVQDAAQAEAKVAAGSASRRCRAPLTRTLCKYQCCAALGRG